jgi:hypothetical protein
VDLCVVVLDYFGLFPKDEAKRAPQIADVEGLVIGVEQEYDAVHFSLKPAGTRPGDSWSIAKVSVKTGGAQ